MTTSIMLTQSTAAATTPTGVVPAGLKFTLTTPAGVLVTGDLTQAANGVATWTFTSQSQFAPGIYQASCFAVDSAGNPIGAAVTIAVTVPPAGTPTTYQAPTAGGLTAALS